MSSSRRNSVRPVVVEVTPDYKKAPSNIAPSSPSSTNKRVSFAPTSSNGSSRPLNSTEAWSIYHFEMHARQCRGCFDPLDLYKRGKSLCSVGHGLAQDVACHVYYKQGDVYSCRKDDSSSKLVRVEIPLGYDQVRLLLRAMEQRLRSHRITPIISYDRSYPVSARYSPNDEREQVYIESAKSSHKSRSSRHKPVRYSTVVVDNDYDDDVTIIPTSLPKDRRGSLYESDLQRKKGYRVEVREPDSVTRQKRRSRDGDGRRDSVWL